MLSAQTCEVFAMKSLEPLLPGQYYHIYNRGNNGENLFYEQKNYRHFLNLYTKYIHPIADTFSYCLLPNHFHFSVRIKDEEEIAIKRTDFKKDKIFTPSQHFSNFFNAYAKAINKGYGRTGSLFEERFGRIPITSEAYFVQLIFYIHFNPQNHGFVNDFKVWQWSSYKTLCSTDKTKLKRSEVLEWFGSHREFEGFHHDLMDEKILNQLIDKDIP